MNSMKKMANENKKMSPEFYKSIHKTPVIIFNGPFDPSYGLKRNKNLRLNKKVARILGQTPLNGTIIGMSIKMNNKNWYLKKKEKFNFQKKWIVRFEIL